jgi:phosphoribosylformylglycinamidine cyclo-ligase
LWYKAVVAKADDQYAAAGVDYGVVDPGKLLAQRAAASTAVELGGRGAREIAASRGESAYVVALGERLLATVTEALGTKNLVADAVRGYTGKTFYDAVGRDTVATILNDLATVGARPLCLCAYWGAGSSEWFADQERMRDLVSGWTAACSDAHAAWGGGETQVLTGMIDPKVLVLGGSAMGFIASEAELLLGSRVRAGDEILIAPATGIHANGLSLARRVAETLPRGYETPVPEDPASRSYGEVLLDPTPLYGVLLEALFDAGVELHYAVNVTGHGFRKLMRATQSLTYVLGALPPVPPVLAMLADAAKLEPSEAYGTFNMGAGFAFYVTPASVERALEVARSRGTTLLRAGVVETGPRRVVIEPLGISFSGEALEIR